MQVLVMKWDKIYKEVKDRVGEDYDLVLKVDECAFSWDIQLFTAVVWR